MVERTPEETDRLAQRNGAIWRDYCAGMTQQALAHREGLSQARVSEIVRQVREGIPEVVREEEVQRSLETLHRLRAGALEIWEMAAAPMVAGKDGSPVIDPESGQYVRDHTGRLRALETALKVDGQIRALLGLDAASKMDLTVSGAEVLRAEQLAEEAAARVRGES